MPISQRAQTSRAVSECRRCSAFCDKLVEPSGCIAAGCRYLYSYEDLHTGGRYMGCMMGVFGAEIDVDSFVLAENNGGYGGIKMAADPLPQCSFKVERAYEGEGPDFECGNRRFFDCDHNGPDGIRAFDLRNALS